MPRKKREAKWEKTKLPALTPDEVRLTSTAIEGPLTRDLLGEYLTFVTRRREAVDEAVGKTIAGWPETARARARGR